ncbi:MAG: hypothetical protein HZA50_19020 [Planctomycetes bacterium]|nr:hypothetical protein [Planctomycetota bacterium]
MNKRWINGFRASVCVLLLLACQAQAQDDQPAKQDKKLKEFNVDFFIGWKDCYRPGEWTPMLVGLTYNPQKGDPKAPLSLTIRISAMQDGQNNLIIERPIVLLPGQRQDQHFTTRLAQRQEGISLELIGQDGREKWKNEPVQYSVNSQFATEIRESDILLAVSGCKSKDLPNLPRKKELFFGHDGRSSEIFIRQKEARLLPWDWPAYSSLDLLVLYDIDWSDMAILKPAQIEAICQWVRGGGTLLIVLGARKLPAEHPFARMLPFKKGEAAARRLSAQTLNALNFHEAASRVENLPPQMVWPLEGLLPPDWHEENFPSDAGAPRMFVYGPHGFGRVGALTFDPAGLEGPAGGGTEGFWAKMIKAMIFSKTGRPSWVPDEANKVIDLWNRTGNTSNAAVLNYLVDLPQMRPLSIWWVIGLLALLGLLLGPIDYFVLKKLKVQPLTWLTSAVIIVLFTVGAYYGVRYIRGNIMRIRAVSVVDAPAGQAEGWSSIYAGIFAPDTESYELTGPDGKALAQSADFKNSWWSGESSLQDGRGRMGTRNIYCRQNDGANIASAVPISIWTMQHLLCEARVAKMPFSAELDEYGNVTVVNHSGRPIKQSWLMRQKPDKTPGFENLGPVQAGGRKVFATKTAEYSGMRDLDIFNAPCVINRTRAMADQLLAGASVVIVEFEDSPLPFAVKGYSSEVSYVAYARQVVFPRSADRSGPDGRDEQGGAASAPAGD